MKAQSSAYGTHLLMSDFLSKGLPPTILSRKFGATSGRADAQLTNVIAELCTRNDAKKVRLGLSFWFFPVDSFLWGCGSSLTMWFMSLADPCDAVTGRAD
jgi:hypothetical protein